MCLAQGDSTVTSQAVSLKLATLWSQVFFCLQDSFNGGNLYRDQERASFPSSRKPADLDLHCFHKRINSMVWVN